MQPSGSANLGKVSDAFLQMTFSDTMTTNLNNNSTYRIRIYAVTYNTLSIMSGLGGLAYYSA